MDSKKIKKNKRVKAWLAPIVYFGLKNKAYDFLENLSYFLSAGMSITSALVSLEEESHSWRMRKVITRIKEDVESGVTLSQSLENQHFFSQSTIEIVRSGETSGKLVDNLKLIITLNDEDRKLKSKISSSLLYGTIIIILTIIVGIGTAWFVLPKIAGVYESMGADLPWLTKVLIAVGKFMVLYGDIFVPAFVSIIFIILYFLFSFPKTKFVGHLILFHLPLIKKLIRESEITRFGVLMGNITKAGLPINRAFEIMPGTTTFKNYKKLYTYLGERVSQGICLSEALKSYKNTRKLFPGSVLQMIVSAEKSGKLAETFLRIGTLYGAKLENTSRNIPIIIEPILLLLVGLGVALFVLATMLPIYNLGNIIK
jgi:type II secretory pathway component PulF